MSAHRLHQGDLLPNSLCVAAAVSATLLSGLRFPEQNNLWHLPVVLDYQNSAEGPHDPYHASFSNFISVFWLTVRQVTTEQNVELVFYTLQLTGNALLALTLYRFARTCGFNSRTTLIASMGIPFCYGLWGATRLGFSELFVTYATHTQYAIVLGLVSLMLLLRERHFLSAVALGASANINLFMAAWTFGCVLLFIAVVQPKTLVRQSLRYTATFILVASPTLIWLQMLPKGPPLPMAFFQDFLRGHVYALDYPRAALQTVLLGCASSLALLSVAANRHASIRRLGLLNLCCTAVLLLALVAPYVVSIPTIGLLHPLRFASVSVLVSAVCALVLFSHCHASDRTADIVPALATLAGFLIKEPIVSILGFAMVTTSTASARWIRATIVIALASTLVGPPTAALTLKLAVCFALLTAILTGATLAYSGDRHTRTEISVKLGALVVAGAMTLLEPTAWGVVATAGLVGYAAARTQRWQSTWLVLAAAATVVAITSGVANASIATILIVGMFLPPVVMLSAWLFGRSSQATARLAHIGRLCVVAPVLLAVPAGYARFLVDHVRAAPRPTNDLEKVATWSRANTPANAVFYLDAADSGFSNRSRRAVWWLPSQGAAAMWAPAFHPSWACRRDAVQAYTKRGDIAALALGANVDYVVSGRPLDQSDARFSVAHQSGTLRVFKVESPPRSTPELCSSKASGAV